MSFYTDSQGYFYDSKDVPLLDQFKTHLKEGDYIAYKTTTWYALGLGKLSKPLPKTIGAVGLHLTTIPHSSMQLLYSINPSSSRSIHIVQNDFIVIPNQYSIVKIDPPDWYKNVVDLLSYKKSLPSTAILPTLSQELLKFFNIS